jgi:acyl-phosphate glycerol 3-phosphate acyltransferase
MKEVLIIVIAYLIGSVPTAVWVSKGFFGIDIREYGSGNAGATNTFRVLGSRWGTFVMVMDVLKGVAATSLYLLLPFYADTTNEWDRTNLMVGLGLAAVLGHIFPIWADFRGGKGVATLFGMIIAYSRWWHFAALVYSCWYYTSPALYPLVLSLRASHSQCSSSSYLMKENHSTEHLLLLWHCW